MLDLLTRKQGRMQSQTRETIVLLISRPSTLCCRRRSSQRLPPLLGRILPAGILFPKYPRIRLRPSQYISRPFSFSQILTPCKTTHKFRLSFVTYSQRAKSSLEKFILRLWAVTETGKAFGIVTA